MTGLPVHGEGVEIFEDVVARLDDLLRRLLEAPAAPMADHLVVPVSPGIYLFSKDDEALYVGQTRNLRTRLRNHTSPLSRENQASFAFLVAKAEADKAGVDLKRTRKILEADKAFAEHFIEAKMNVAAMDVRFIELEGEIERTLFEVYASLALDTLLYNSFETH
jgi:predicted GIY-YIG superfamily endonuclease